MIWSRVCGGHGHPQIKGCPPPLMTIPFRFMKKIILICTCRCDAPPPHQCWLALSDATSFNLDWIRHGPLLSFRWESTCLQYSNCLNVWQHDNLHGDENQITTGVQYIQTLSMRQNWAHPFPMLRILPASWWHNYNIANNHTPLIKNM